MIEKNGDIKIWEDQFLLWNCKRFGFTMSSLYSDCAMQAKGGERKEKKKETRSTPFF